MRKRGEKEEGKKEGVTGRERTRGGRVEERERERERGRREGGEERERVRERVIRRRERVRGWEMAVFFLS